MTDYHKSIRDAVVLTIEALPLSVPTQALDDPDNDLNGITLPACVCACVGPEQRRGEWDTNAHDGLGFAVAVLLMAGGVTSGAKTPNVPDITFFRRQVHNLFHMKRLSGVAEVGWCEVSDSGPLFQKDGPAFQKLVTGLVVLAVGRFPRS